MLDYKILTAVLTARLNKIRGGCVHQNQTGFMKDCQLRDNVRRLYNIIYHAQATKVPTLLYFCNAEKAFNRVQWDFLNMLYLKKELWGRIAPF